MGISGNSMRYPNQTLANPVWRFPRLADSRPPLFPLPWHRTAAQANGEVDSSNLFKAAKGFARQEPDQKFSRAIVGR